ncbi:unnamed protein product [Soboliphyme baturini]|uniref:SCP2 domain-containing protein n=1 Tax=Soboliphyme baturini TaxID=241478 RepID=A0A183I9Y5_9BILA|nr:unnamed protein product [Soboliphyme baturini]
MQSSDTASRSQVNLIASIFNSLQTMLNKTETDLAGKVFTFNVTDVTPNQWYVNLKSTPAKCAQGSLKDATPDVEFMMDSDTLVLIFNGKLKPSTAFVTGKMKFTGNFESALQMEKLVEMLTNP